MRKKTIFLLVEGDDDKRFIETVIKPMLESKFDVVSIQKYARRKSTALVKLLKSIKKNGSAHFCTGDFNSSSCITQAKTAMNSRFDNEIENHNIVIVIKKIEGWYLAGLTENRAQEMGVEISLPENTDSIGKRKFYDFKPKYLDKRDYMIEVLKGYSSEQAAEKNSSFSYFLRKLDFIE